MNKITIAAVAALALGGAAYLYFGQPQSEPVAAPPGEGEPMVAVTLPETLSQDATIGKRAFDATCAACHGANAAGKLGSGPPLVHKIYEPSHHGDMAFVLAAQQGVRSHHWKFGDMPPQPGLTPADVLMIAGYVRELQRANGIN
ncbi:c-type cytochrome [Puniceibacterium confluentis]|uniref:c-type cytochrome n=1 Tax=Puniceibacterium confluentis TaxID=1958944 RepID=UPI0011B7FF84|nr:cytochrome c [Puniceibacterium confluentis]